MTGTCAAAGVAVHIKLIRTAAASVSLCVLPLTRLAALGTLSRTAGERGPSPRGRVGEGLALKTRGAAPYGRGRPPEEHHLGGLDALLFLAWTELDHLASFRRPA